VAAAIGLRARRRPSADAERCDLDDAGMILGYAQRFVFARTTNGRVENVH